MKNILFLICALSFFYTGFISVVHAHVQKQNVDMQIELSTDQKDIDTETSFGSSCDVHCHSHVLLAIYASASLSTENAGQFSLFSEDDASSFIYRLKYPPKI